MGEHWNNTVRRSRHVVRSVVMASTFGCVMTALVLFSSGDTRMAAVVLATPPALLVGWVVWRVRRAAAAEDG